MAKRMTHEEYLTKFNEATKGEYELLSIYKSSILKVKIKHLKCGCVFDMLPTNIICKTKGHNQGCPNCRYKKTGKSRIKSTSEKVLNEIQFTLGNDYDIIGEYKGRNKKIKIFHKPCNTNYEATPNTILGAKSKCPICAEKERAKRRAFTHKEYVEKVFNVVKEEYSVISEYTKKRDKIKIRHNTCGYEFELFPLDFLEYPRCLKCRRISKGEDKIREWLIKNNFAFQEQYKIKECKNKRPLPFDFAVFIKESLTLIEYQGTQHYKKSGYFKGEAKLIYTQKNDTIKKEYCNKNNISLLIIPYWEFKNIETVLNKIILKERC